MPVIVAINHFATDTDAEVTFVKEKCSQYGVPVAFSEVFSKGGEGGVELAKLLCDTIDNEPSNFKPLYDTNLPIDEKIKTIVTEIYGGDDVIYSAKAMKAISTIESLGYGNLPVCMAKTQYSLSDNPSLLGHPSGFSINVKDIILSAGAGFIVVITGDIMTMPGLPKTPSAEKIDILSDGTITGLF